MTLRPLSVQPVSWTWGALSLVRNNVSRSGLFVIFAGSHDITVVSIDDAYY